MHSRSGPLSLFAIRLCPRARSDCQAFTGKTELLQTLSGGYYSNALQAAAANGYASIIAVLLDEGAEINAVGGPYGTCLRAAIEAGNEETVVTLVARGADVNAVQKDFSNALLSAPALGLRKIVTILLENGADVSMKDG